MNEAPALAVEGLCVELTNGSPIVDDVSFEVPRGNVLGLVGESGSGKTTTALALLGYARPGVHIRHGSIRVNGEELVGRAEPALRRLRGRLVSYVPQDPAAALNPSGRIGSIVAEMIRNEGASSDVVHRALRRVHLPDDEAFRRRFPHQLSGGQQQRVAIAVALVGEPPVVVLDEPTTGLDVVTQARVLDEIRRLQSESRLSMVYVSHDLAVVGSIADRIAVFYAGRVVEEGPAREILTRPRHPYTRGLVASIPDHVTPRRLRGIEGVAVGVGDRPEGCAFAPRCAQRLERCLIETPSLEPTSPGHRVSCHAWRTTPALTPEPARSGVLPRSIGAMPLLRVESLAAVHTTRQGTTVAASDVGFEIGAGECVALVGESGSGKTTIARCVAGLHPPERGRIMLDGTPLEPHARQRSREARRRIQIVFQNPYDSLNPRHRVGDAVARPAQLLRGLSGKKALIEAESLLERVRLPARTIRKYPRELSGGERQRVAIARALATQPDLVVCDEITSALDVSVQAAVIELLETLRADLGLALLFISHNLGVVASTADRVLVLDRGVVCEQGDVASVLSEPQNTYTRALLEAAPRLSTEMGQPVSAGDSAWG